MQIWDVSGAMQRFCLRAITFYMPCTMFNEELPEKEETFSPCDSSIRVRPNLGLFKFETEKTPR